MMPFPPSNQQSNPSKAWASLSDALTSCSQCSAIGETLNYNLNFCVRSHIHDRGIGKNPSVHRRVNRRTGHGACCSALHGREVPMRAVTWVDLEDMAV